MDIKKKNNIVLLIITRYYNVYKIVLILEVSAMNRLFTELPAVRQTFAKLSIIFMITAENKTFANYVVSYSLLRLRLNELFSIVSKE